MIEHKILYKNRWVSIRSIADKKKGIKPYYYKHIESSDGCTVAVLPYRIIDGKPEYMVVEELRPPWDIRHLERKYLSSIAGCVEDDETTLEAAVREFNEETPYNIQDVDRFEYLGKSFITKSSDTVVTQFLIEITPDDIPTQANGDGSHMETTAKPTWITFQEGSETQDPLIAQMIMRFMFRKINDYTQL
jgi:8-oxo-dGTP pyrophosphatase MutT (NUDIX family)